VLQQRGGAATKHVGPNGVRPSGGRRPPLHNTQHLRDTRRRLQLVLQIGAVVFARIVVAHGRGAGREDSRRFSVKSKAKEGLADVPVIEKGTTVTDFCFRNGPTAFNTSALNPAVVSDNFPLVYRIPWRSTFRSSKL